MNVRKWDLGNRNLIGTRVTVARQRLGMKQIELLAKLQTAGIDISVPALSLLEDQKRQPQTRSSVRWQIHWAFQWIGCWAVKNRTGHRTVLRSSISMS